MLIGIINDKDAGYYVHLNNKNNKFSWYMVKCSNSILEGVDYNFALDLFDRIFDKNLSFIEKKNDYYIFLDGISNKRFFKDNHEDMDMFFRYNGFDAIKYIDKDNQNKSNVKRFKLRKDVTIICSSLLFLVFGPSIGVKMYDLANNYLVPYNVYMDYEKADSLLNKSSHLSDDDKEFLCNEDYLSDVIKYSSGKRNHALALKFTDVEVDSFTKEEKSYCSGYYSSLSQNKIFVRDYYMSNESTYKDVLAHEFIHLTQTDFTKYSYIHEACAEILSNEFYDTKISSYFDWVKRVKILMEIIGPGPVLECNFKSDDSLEECIYKYLDEDDAISLLDCFKVNCTDLTNMSNEEIKEFNKKVDSLLGKMYFNKTGKSIEKDLYINLIYIDANACENRVYFNTHNDSFYKDLKIDEEPIYVDHLDFNEVINSKNITSIKWHSNKYYTEDEYTKCVLNDGIEHFSTCFFSKELDGVSSRFVDGEGIIYTYNGVDYDEFDAWQNGLIYKVFNVVDNIEVDDINKVIPNEGDIVTLTLDDESRIVFKYDFKNKCWHDREVFVYSPIFEDSIYKKFPEQLNLEEKEDDIHMSR